MRLFSEQFHINMEQARLDFVDIDLDGDTPLYLDPYALTSRDDEWSEYCHELVVSFFNTVISAIKVNDIRTGVRLLSYLGEPEETHLGVSQDGNKGRGIGATQARQLFLALRNSNAAKTGLLSDLPDLALFIPLIGRDKISDMTTNIIRRALISYTQDQCVLHDVPMRNVASGMYWNSRTHDWDQCYCDLPVFENTKVLLVPKYSVRYQVGVDHQTYRSKFVLEFLQEELLRIDDRLVATLRDKKGVITKRKPYKKDIDSDARFPKTKDFLADFSASHPAVIQKYKEMLKDQATRVPSVNPVVFDERVLANLLAQELKEIPGGAADADVYHQFIVGVISFLYFPNLIYPKKEAPINNGRKRIDILYTNGKDKGFFRRMGLDPKIKANVIIAECKNYTNDIANAELDQLLGRFDHQRGELGLLFYRKNTKEDVVLQRCRDAARADRGIVLPINDAFVQQALSFIADGNRNELDRQIDTLYVQVIS